MTVADSPQLQALSAFEKIQLIEDLWVSVMTERPSFPLSEQQEAVLEARLAQDDAYPEAALTVEEFRKELARRM